MFDGTTSRPSVPDLAVRLSAIRLWFDPDSIIHSRPDALLAAEVSFRGLDRDVAQQELYLLQLTARRVAQPRAGPSPMPHAA